MATVLEQPPQTPAPIAPETPVSPRQTAISQVVTGLDPAVAKTVTSTFQNKSLSDDQLKSFLTSLPVPSDKVRHDLWNAYYTYEPPVPKGPPAMHIKTH